MNGIHRRSRPALVAVLMASLSLLASCERPGAAAGPSVEGLSGTTAERDGDRAALKSAEGDVVRQGGEALSLPEQFPDDVYLPRDYVVNSAMDVQAIRVVSLSAPGTVAGLFGEARDAMHAQGWTQTLAAQHSADTAMLSFEKPDGAGQRSATLSFNRNNGEDKVIVGVQLRDAAP